MQIIQMIIIGDYYVIKIVNIYITDLCGMAAKKINV